MEAEDQARNVTLNEVKDQFPEQSAWGSDPSLRSG
jgi:hypothetical protein